LTLTIKNPLMVRLIPMESIEMRVLGKYLPPKRFQNRPDLVSKLDHVERSCLLKVIGLKMATENSIHK